MKRCAIIGSVPVKNTGVLKEYCVGSFVVCADGGLDTALETGIRPNLIVGDFDSAKASPPPEVETVRLSVHKDDTDTMFAIKEAMRRGYHDFSLFGILGGERFDHSFASLCALQYIAAQNDRGVIFGDNCKIFMMTGGKLRLTRMKGCGISVFPFGSSCCTVSYRGLEYPLMKHTLYSYDPLGVSNSIAEDDAQVILHSGTALIIVLEPNF
jgi:thiamine pyrophosphokinase